MDIEDHLATQGIEVVEVVEVAHLNGGVGATTRLVAAMNRNIPTGLIALGRGIGVQRVRGGRAPGETTRTATAHVIVTCLPGDQSPPSIETPTIGGD